MSFRMKVPAKPLAIIALVLTWFVGSVQAGELPAPEGRVVLKITGAIANTTDGKAAHFDIAMLKAMSRATISTSTPWTQGVVDFAGVPLKELMSVVEVKGSQAKVTALNDYSVTMTIADLVDTGAILAYEIGGKALSIREKGPLWIIFPFDSNERYQTDAYWSKSVWQVRDMAIK